MPESQTYTCAVCKGTFIKGWSDEETEAELDKTFPSFTTDDCDLICDDCYKQMGLNNDH